MARALRVVSVERGIDPREMALVAFGGAGPLHGCDVAEELGMRRVILPRAAGLLAALGLVVAGERRDEVLSVLTTLDEHADLSDAARHPGIAARRRACPVRRSRRRPTAATSGSRIS